MKTAHSPPALRPCPALDDFTSMYDLYSEAIFRYCYWRCRDRDIGMDLMQETFLRFCQCLQRRDQILNPRAFLYRIAHNLFLNHVRKRKEASLDQLLDVGFEPSEDLWHETRSRMDAEGPLEELRKMKAPFRQVLHRRFILEQTPAEIAADTGETSNSVSVRTFRALKHLRVILEDKAWKGQRVRA